MFLNPIAPLVNAQSVSPTRCDRKFYSENDILYYNPCDSSTSCTTGQVSVSSNATISNIDAVKTIYTYLTTTPISSNGNKPLTPAQAAGVMGNMDAESGFNPSAIEDTSRADKGHGLVQWTFGRWTNLSNFATQQGKPWDDINIQLAFLKSELEGPEQAVLQDSEFASTTDPSIAAQRWRIVFERADPAQAHDEKRIGSAIAIYTLFGGTAASCQAAGAAVAGDFVKTAINFALTAPATGSDQATAAYQQAVKQYNPSVDLTDCGGFIATSLFASGVDMNYPNVGVSAQLAYVQSHPEKYIVNPHPTLNDLQPGDILYISGHTTLYTGASPYPMVDASLGDRVPSVRPTAALQWMLSQPEITSARLIK
jgi:hypothetical protein